MSSDGRASRLASIRAHCLAKTDVFVIAGGLGTRIAPVLGDVPKLLAPISGRPYLSYLLDWLWYFGARRIVLGLGYRAQPIIEYLKLNSSMPEHTEVETVIEPYPLGTAGAIRFARHRLRTDPVLVMNGDSFADADLCDFVSYHAGIMATATLLCANVDDAGRYGRVELDANGRIRGFIEKDQQFHGSGLVNAGMYLFSAVLLDEISAGCAVSLERDVFERASAGTFASFTGKFRFIDIGTPESLAAAELTMKADAGRWPA